MLARMQDRQALMPVALNLHNILHCANDGIKETAAEDRMLTLPWNACSWPRREQSQGLSERTGRPNRTWLHEDTNTDCLQKRRPFPHLGTGFFSLASGPAVTQSCCRQSKHPERAPVPSRQQAASRLLRFFVIGLDDEHIHFFTARPAVKSHRFYWPLLEDK